MDCSSWVFSAPGLGEVGTGQPEAPHVAAGRAGGGQVSTLAHGRQGLESQSGGSGGACLCAERCHQRPESVGDGCVPVGPPGTRVVTPCARPWLALRVLALRVSSGRISSYRLPWAPWPQSAGLCRPSPTCVAAPFARHRHLRWGFQAEPWSRPVLRLLERPVRCQPSSKSPLGRLTSGC